MGIEIDGSHKFKRTHSPYDGEQGDTNMRNEKQVNVRTHGIRAANRNGGTGSLVDVETQHGEPEPNESTASPLPYLEDVMVIAKKYPYSALTAMIAIASVIIAAVVTLGVAMFTGMFLMYGQQARTETKLDTFIEQQIEIKSQLSVTKTLYQAVLARQDFMNGLASREYQEAVNAYDRTHPRPLLPDPPPTPSPEVKQ